MNEEIWKSIEGYNGLYEVSSFGRVRSLRLGKTKILKPGKNTCGYLRVELHKDGEKKKFLIHRLVAEEFIPNPEGKPQVNHKSEVKTENFVENLEWTTRSENINYGTRNERAGMAKSKPVLQYSKDWKFLQEFPSIIEAYKHTDINNRDICSCCLGKRKSAGGYIWKYKENPKN